MATYSFAMAVIHLVGILLSIITGIVGSVAALTYSGLSDLRETHPELETLILRHTISLTVVSDVYLSLKSPATDELLLVR